MDIEENELQLRPYQDEHVMDTVAWLSRPDIRAEFGISYEVTEEGHRRWLKNQDDLMLWAIHVNGIYIGNVSLRVIDRHKKAYFEIYIGDSQYQGTGLGRRTLDLICHHVFSELNFNRLYLYTHNENTRANALYKSFGFIKEGVERESIFKDGKYVDQIIWGLLSSEWKRGVAR